MSRAALLRLREDLPARCFAYLLAAALTGLAVLVRWSLDPWIGDRLPLVTTFGAVAAAVWVGGCGPAALALVLGYSACNVLFIQPRGVLALSGAYDAIGVVLYSITCSAIIAFGESMRSARRRARLGQDLLRVTFASIGDAVITTDDESLVTYLNGVAESLTGWRSEDAEGQALETVFRTIDEHTRKSADSPVAKVLQDGVVVGPANHTLLVAKDGTEIPIDDNASPIRDSAGRILGCVLIFRDIGAKKRAAAEETRLGRQLRDRVQELQTLLELLPLPVWIGDAECRRITGNGAAYRTHGFEPGTNASFDAAERELPAGVRVLAEGRELESREMPMQVAAATGRPVQGFEHEVVHADGRRISLSANVAPLLDDEGRVRGVVGAYVDVTERKRNEEILRASEQRFRRMADAAPVLIWISDPDKLFTWFNRRWLEFVGRSLEDELGDGWARSIHPADRDRCSAAFGAAFDARGPFSMEYRRRRADGEYRWVLDTGVPLHGPSSEFTGYMGSAIDISDKKRAELALRAKEAELQLVADTTPLLLVRCGRDLRYRFANRAAAALFGLEPAQMVGRPIVEVMGEQAFALISPYVERVLGGEPVEFEARIPYRAAGPRWVRASYAPERDAQGAVAGWVASITDITELKEAEVALKEADRRKDEFLATLAHELRNPLAPIRNAIQVLLVKGSDDPELRRCREVIDRQVQHMARLLDDLLDVSRISYNRLELRKERVTLDSVIQHAVETSRPHVDGGGHRLTISLPEATVHLEVDVVRIAQVFSNLLNNAAKYTEANGNIHLSAAVIGDQIAVSVKDDGIGIPAEMMQRVFSMFSQAKNVLERSQGGLGIGLSLVQGLVELHGGSVEVRSEGSGKGSEFIVRLPLGVGGAAPEPAAIDGGVRASAASARLLIADDLRDNADTLAMLLRLAGHEVRTCYDGEGAMALAESFRPDVALLDIGMPKRNGLDVCRQIREKPWGKEMFLIAVTGWGQQEDRRRTMEAGFDQHIVKPVDPALLLRLLDDRPAKPVIDPASA